MYIHQMFNIYSLHVHYVHQIIRNIAYVTFLFACNISFLKHATQTREHKIQWTLFYAVIGQAMGGIMHCGPRGGVKCDCPWQTDHKQDQPLTSSRN